MSVILATAGYDHKIRFWEAPSGICSRTLRFPGSQVNCLEITPDKQFLAAAGNPLIRLYEINSTNHNPALSCEGHTASVTGLGFQREGRWMFSSSEDGTIKIFDLRSPKFQRSFDCGVAVNTVALHPNQAQLISGDQNGSVKVWDLSTSSVSQELMSGGDDVPVRAVAISDDGERVVAVNNDAEAFVFEQQGEKIGQSKAWKLVKRFESHPTGYCLKAKFSPDCRTLATTGSDKTAKIWNTKNWTCTKTLNQHQRWVWDAVFSADSSYLVTASSDHSARLWNLRTGEVVRQYTGHQSAVTCVALRD
jgi:G protein beta subunit-like protein